MRLVAMEYTRQSMVGNSLAICLLLYLVIFVVLCQGVCEVESINTTCCGGRNVSA
jgi:hypothetical protein